MNNRHVIRICLIVAVMLVVSTIMHASYTFPGGDRESVPDGCVYWYDTQPPGVVILKPLRYEAMDVGNGSSREITALIFDIGMPPDILGNTREEQPVNVSKLSISVFDHNNLEYLQPGEWEIVDKSPGDGDDLLGLGETFTIVIPMPFPVSGNASAWIEIGGHDRSSALAEFDVPDEIMESGSLEFRYKNTRYLHIYSFEES